MKREITEFLGIVTLGIIVGLALACGGGGGGGGGADVTAPTITSTSPANNATSVAINTTITATFSEALDNTTVSNTSFTVSGGVTGTVTYDTATYVATFTPAADLAYATIYTVTITTDVTDAIGNALAATNTWNFTTLDVPDTTPPTVADTIPADTAVGVALNVAITATFDEAMSAATIDTASFTLNNGVTGTVTYDAGSYVATFTPNANLAASTTYIATITTAVEDASSNALAAAYTWTFDTGLTADATAPTVTATTPVDTTTGVAFGATVSAEFDEAINASTITTSTFTLSDGTAAVTGTVDYDSINMIATFTPTSPLTGSLEYTATLTTGVQDLAGNGLAAAYEWSFVTTGAWAQHGLQVSPAGAESEDPTMLVVDDKPAVGYRHASFEVNLHYWDDVALAWSAAATDPAGGNANSSIHSTPSFASNGSAIYMAYSHAGVSGAGDAAFYDRIFARSWTEAGGWAAAAMNSDAEISVPYDAVTGGANAWEPVIVVRDGDTTPLVAWVETDVAPDPDGDDDSWVAIVTDNAVTRGTALSRNNTVGDYATDIRCLGMVQRQATRVYLAQWEQHHTDQDRTDLYVTEWNNGAVTNLGSLIASDYDSNNLSVPSLENQGNSVYVAYSIANDTDNTRHVYVGEWDGAVWTTLGDGPVSAYSAMVHYDSANPDLLLVDGTLTIAWEESSQTDGYFIYTAVYDANRGEWLIDGDKLNVTQANSAHDPSLAYDATNGYLYISFEEFTDGWPHIFVKRKELAPAAP